MKALRRLIFAMTITGLLAAITNGPSDAARSGPTRSSYDGEWSVAIYTLQGECGAVRAALRIFGSRVYSVDQSYQAYGAVSSRGAVRVTVVRGNQSASGSGRMSHTSGAGRWRSFRGECSGTWSATRHPAYY